MPTEYGIVQFHPEIFQSELVCELKGLYDYVKQDQAEIGFNEDDTIILLSADDPDGWWLGENARTKERGIFPIAYAWFKDDHNHSMHSLMNIRTAIAKFYSRETKRLGQDSIYWVLEAGKKGTFSNDPVEQQLYEKLIEFLLWPETRKTKNQETTSVELQQMNFDASSIWECLFGFLTPLDAVRFQSVNKSTRNYLTSGAADAFWKAACRGMELGNVSSYRNLYAQMFKMMRHGNETQPTLNKLYADTLFNKS